ncbi:MAG: CbtA family protein [Rhizobiales bacterium]|nr:CbtA family protein [Hyphomicrobiales bacterium]
MNYFRNVVFIAAIAGLVAGLAMTVMQAFTTDPLILQAEVYENAEAAAPAAAEAAHDHDQAAMSTAEGEQAAAPAHEHDDEGWSPADGFERNAYNVLANLVGAIGFGLVLVAASELAGGMGDWRQGVFWGLAGFTVFTLAPSLGLNPELPAMPAADLLSRQIWWIGTAAATAVALYLLFLRRSPALAALGIAILVVPHIIGAPQPADHSTPIPENLHHSFIVASTLTNLVFWVVLGAAVATVRARFAEPAGDARRSFA